MEYVALIIAIIALVVAVIAYQKVGGAADLKKQAEVLSNLGDSIVKATDSLRDKTADLFDKMGGAVRGAKEDAKPPVPPKPKAAKKPPAPKKEGPA